MVLFVDENELPITPYKPDPPQAGYVPLDESVSTSSFLFRSSLKSLKSVGSRTVMKTTKSRYNKKVCEALTPKQPRRSATFSVQDLPGVFYKPSDGSGLISVRKRRNFFSRLRARTHGFSMR